MPFIIESPSPSPPPSFPDAAAIRREEHHSADVIVIGAGVLGSAIAVTFARQGRSVILLEQSLKQPDRIVGELLQPGGVEALEQLGLRHCLEDIDAIPVFGYEVIYYGTPVHIPYPQNSVSTGMKPEGRSFHHGRFIQKLRETAFKEPNITVRETKAVSLIRNEYSGQVLGVECQTKEKPDYYFGALTVVADGYSSKFRKEFSTRTPLSKSKFYGLELIDTKLPNPGHGHVVLSENAPVLLYQIGTRETRILVDIPEGTPTATYANGGAKGHLKNVVLPSLPQQVQPAFAKALQEDTVRSMPNSWLPPSTNRAPGVILLGDALNMRHPLTGGGMTAALNDVVLLRTLLSPEVVPDFLDTTKVLQQMRKFHWQRKNLTSVINILAQALYSLFAANGRSYPLFDYLY
jgi:squalene monooxygenase